MPADLEYYLNQLDSKWTDCHNDLIQVSSWFYSLGDELLAQDWAGAHDVCDILGARFIWLYDDLTDSLITVRYYIEKSLWYINNNAFFGEVTWKSICEAWIKDDFEGREWTIACIDRMRQILWNEPFNILWAARPEDKKGEL